MSNELRRFRMFVLATPGHLSKTKVTDGQKNSVNYCLRVSFAIIIINNGNNNNNATGKGINKNINIVGHGESGPFV